MRDYRSPYTECEECDHLLYDPEHELLDGTVPCPRCGANAPFRTWWPFQEDVHAILELVHQQYVGLAQPRVIAVTFLATGLERLLEIQLWDILSRSGTDLKAGTLLLDAYRGRERRIALYNSLSPRPVQSILENADLPSFLMHWQRLTEARNRLVHGAWQAGYDAKAETIEYLRDHCYQAFAALHEDARNSGLPKARGLFRGGEP